MTQAPVYQSVDALQEFATRCFVAVGMESNDATLVADTLIAAELRGVTSHGLVRLPVYLRNLKDGQVDARARPVLIADAPAVALVNGQRAMGQVASKHAMDLAIGRARGHGIGAVAVRNSNHFGAGAYWAMLALPEQMIGVAMTNGAVARAPTGGVTPLLGNNPIAVASPGGSEQPIVLDMAQTMVARGWIKLAAMRGQPLPDGWAQDAEGRPTNDPAAALDGSLLPIGGYKGYGLSIVVELLSAAISGAAMGPALENMGFTAGAHEERRYAVHDVGGVGTGHFFLAIDIARFLPLDQYTARVDALVRTMKASTLGAGVESILLPGEREFVTEGRRRETGVPMSDEVSSELRSASELTDIPVP